MLWDPILMKVLVKKEVCESCEQCTGSTGKDRNAFLKKKKKKIADPGRKEALSKCSFVINFSTF